MKELHTMAQKIIVLSAQRDEAETKLRQALEEVASLRQELASALKEIHKQKLDIEFLSLSHKLADSPQALADARTKVKRMIAEVDKAISLLNEDARI